MGENPVENEEKLLLDVFLELEKEWRFIIHQKRQYL